MQAHGSPWEQTLKVLAQTSRFRLSIENSNAESSHPRAKKRGRLDLPMEQEDVSPSAHVSILERCSTKEVSLCWCDATRGRYGDQRWILQVARRNTVCALSGAMIRRGDSIYRQRLRGRSPCNAGQAILAEALHKLEAGIQEIQAAGREDAERVVSA